MDPKIKTVDTKVVPEEIKRFNWGALLLSGFWCVRHGLWGSLVCLFIPIFGFFIMPMVLGFKGNKWAWEKNHYESTQQFLKQQRRWCIAGFLAWVMVPIILAITMLPILNYAYQDIKFSLNIANKNDHVIEYFGTPMQPSFWNYKYKSKSKNGSNIVEARFKVIGSKNSGYINMKMVGLDDKWLVYYLRILDENKQETSVVMDVDVDGSDPIEAIGYDSITRIQDSMHKWLKEMKKEKYGYNDNFLIYFRSKALNDFMQTAMSFNDNGDKCFLLQYSDGYTPANKNLYEHEECFVSNDYVANIFYEYATGNDDFKKNTGWKKFIENKKHQDENGVYYEDIYEE